MIWWELATGLAIRPGEGTDRRIVTVPGLFRPDAGPSAPVADVDGSRSRSVAGSEVIVMTATSPIERVVLTHLQIPLKEPFRISGGEVAVKDAILVTVETSSGIGHGESSPMAAGFGYSADTPEGCWDDLRDRDRSQPDRPGRSTRPRPSPRSPSAWKGSRFAVAGAETALWDLLGQAHHATIAELLGAIDEQISLGVQSGLAVGLYPSIVELLKTIETHLAEGYRRVKIKIQPGSDVELVRAVRQHFGEIPLMVDANGAYTAADIDVFRELDDFDLLMFEQPMAADDLDGLAQLQKSRHHAGLPRRDGRDLEQTAEAIRRGACRIVNIKIQRVGGLGPARAIHDLCHQQGIACWVGSMPELGHRPGRRHPPGDAGQLQVPHRRRAVRPLVRRRLRRPAARARRAGAVQRPHPARPGLSGRPGQGPPLPGSPGGIHGHATA